MQCFTQEVNVIRSGRGRRREFFEENGPLQLSCMEDGSGLKMRGCTKITLSNFGAGVHFCYLPVAQ